MFPSLYLKVTNAQIVFGNSLPSTPYSNIWKITKMTNSKVPPKNPPLQSKIIDLQPRYHLFTNSSICLHFFFHEFFFTNFFSRNFFSRMKKSKQLVLIATRRLGDCITWKVFVYNSAVCLHFYLFSRIFFSWKYTGGEGVITGPAGPIIIFRVCLLHTSP